MKHLIKLLLSKMGAVNISYSGHNKEFYYTLNSTDEIRKRNILTYYDLCKLNNISPTKFWINNFGG